MLQHETKKAIGELRTSLRPDIVSLSAGELDSLQNVMGSSLAHAAPFNQNVIKIGTVGFFSRYPADKQTNQRKQR